MASWHGMIEGKGWGSWPPAARPAIIPAPPLCERALVASNADGGNIELPGETFFDGVGSIYL